MVVAPEAAVGLVGFETLPIEHPKPDCVASINLRSAVVGLNPFASSRNSATDLKVIHPAAD